MVPTIVGLCVVIVGLVAWITFLTIALYDVRDTAAGAIDAQTTIYIKLNARVKALEPKDYPKYLGTLTGSEIAAEDAVCEGIDPVWGEHDARVAEALTQAVRPSHRVITSNPDEHPFFGVTPDQSADFDADTTHRLTELRKTVTTENT